MASNQWGDSPDNPYLGAYDPFDGGGTYSGGIGVHIDPKTGRVDPNYHPPAQGSSGGNSGVGSPGSSGSGGAAPATTAVKTGILGSSLSWSDVINAALAIYSLHKADQTPNFYTAPETPAEKYKNEQTKNLYGFASGYTEQYLKGLGNLNPDFQMPNNLTGNPAFMGGVKVPTIDFSKVPPINGAAPPASATPTTPTTPAAPTAPNAAPPGVPLDPSRVKVDPSTGKLTVDNPTPQEQAFLDSLNAVIAGKAGAPGTP